MSEDYMKEKNYSIQVYSTLSSFLYKLDGVASLVTNPPHGNSTIRQNPPIFNILLFIGQTKIYHCVEQRLFIIMLKQTVVVPQFNLIKLFDFTIIAVY